jgi:hypothetical protein
VAAEVSPVVVAVFTAAAASTAGAVGGMPEAGAVVTGSPRLFNLNPRAARSNLVALLTSPMQINPTATSLPTWDLYE